MQKLVSDGKVTEDMLFKILQNTERRDLLLELTKGNSNSLTRPKKSASKEQSVKMLHTHLPKLDNANIINWNQETGKVTRSAEFTRVEPFLKLLLENPEKRLD